MIYKILLLCLWPWPPWPLPCCWLCCCSRGPLQPLQPREARAGSWEVRATTAACQLCEPPDRLLAFAIFTPLASQPRSIGNILARSLNMISLAMIQLDFTSKMVRGWKLISCSLGQFGFTSKVARNLKLIVLAM